MLTYYHKDNRIFTWYFDRTICKGVIIAPFGLKYLMKMEGGGDIFIPVKNNL